MSWFRSHSLRVSLTLWNVAAMIVVMAVYASGVFMFVGRYASSELNAKIREDSQWATAMADQRPDGSLRWFGDESNFGENSPWLQVWSDGKIIYRTENAERNPIPRTEQLASHPTDSIVPIKAGAATFRVLTAPVTINLTDEHNRPTGVRHVVIQVVRSEKAMRQEMARLLNILLLGLPIGVAAAGISGYLLARRALAPVERMAERAQSITAANLHDRLPVHDPNDDLGRLASVFNDTLGRLEASFDQMRRFTADVSHELRTPLTAIRSVGEVGLRGRRDEKAYRGIIGSMLEEVDRLASLVDRLLRWSRAETGQAKMAQEVIDLHDLAEEIVAHLGVLAEEKRQSLVVEQMGTPRGLGDRLVLRQALINLLDNAIKYTPVGGEIRVRVSELPAAATIDVVDSGPGIAADLRSRIFDRYNRDGRTEPTESTAPTGPAAPGEIGGAGLGLSISKWAVEANGGRLTLEPSPEGLGTGSTFRITLPLAASATGARSPDSRRKSVA